MRWMTALFCCAALATACGPETSGEGEGEGEGEEILGELLVVRLSWTQPGNLDLGATTPGGIVAANYDEADADALCTHDGDDEGTAASNSESFSCHPRAGLYRIVIDSFASGDVDYDLTVRLDDAPVTPNVDVSGTTITPNSSHNVELTF